MITYPYKALMSSTLPLQAFGLYCIDDNCRYRQAWRYGTKKSTSLIETKLLSDVNQVGLFDFFATPRLFNKTLPLSLYLDHHEESTVPPPA